MDIKVRAIEEMKKLFGSDQKRINHALKVLKFSEEIMSGEGLDEDGENIVILSAVLHDIGIQEAEKKYGSSSGKYQEIEGPPIAKKIMEDLGVSQKYLERVCYIIGGHHTSSKIDGQDFQTLWEADLLVNIEEDGLDKGNTDLRGIVDKNFKTVTGRKIAEKMYLR